MNIKRVKLIYFSPTRTTKKIMESISEGLKFETVESVDLTPPAMKTATPGKYPYKERRKRQPVSPVTREDLCTKCGQCADVCPEAAIKVEETVVTDPTTCINCFACVKNCPSGARRMEDRGYGRPQNG